MNCSWDMLHQAISLYLRSAYPSGEIPEVVRKRIMLDSSQPLAESLGNPPFEHYAADAPFRCTVYALRLGSQHYPHLKMEIRPFPNQAGFVFWVNTHDQFIAPDADYADDRWRHVLRCNRELKQQVERDWSLHRLPTFATAMQEDIDKD